MSKVKIIIVIKFIIVKDHSYSHLIKKYTDIIKLAKDWIKDCDWDDAEFIQYLPNEIILKGVDQAYEGGINQFIKDNYDNTKISSKNKPLNKPHRTPKGPKKFSVYVKTKNGNIIKINFGDPNMSIKRDNSKNLKSFRARHKCDSDPRAKNKETAKYWSCKFWQKNKTVNDLLN